VHKPPERLETAIAVAMAEDGAKRSCAHVRLFQRLLTATREWGANY
jgi:hypothetical protein